MEGGFKTAMKLGSPANAQVCNTALARTSVTGQLESPMY
jgi:hypothetical protein